MVLTCGPGGPGSPFWPERTNKLAFYLRNQSFIFFISLFFIFLCLFFLKIYSSKYLFIFHWPFHVKNVLSIGQLVISSAHLRISRNNWRFIKISLPLLVFLFKLNLPKNILIGSASYRTQYVEDIFVRNGIFLCWSLINITAININITFQYQWFLSASLFSIKDSSLSNLNMYHRNWWSSRRNYEKIISGRILVYRVRNNRLFCYH